MYVLKIRILPREKLRVFTIVIPREIVITRGFDCRKRSASYPFIRGTEESSEKSWQTEASISRLVVIQSLYTTVSIFLSSPTTTVLALPGYTLSIPDYLITDQREALLGSPYSPPVCTHSKPFPWHRQYPSKLSLSLCKVSSSSVSPYKPSRLYYPALKDVDLG